MKLNPNKTVKELAAIIDCKIVGSEAHVVTGINEIHRVEVGDLVFVDHPKYYDKALKSKATTILIDQEVDCPEGKVLLVSKQPFDDFNKLTKHFSPFIQQLGAVGENTTIDPSALIYPNVFIGHNCVIGKNVTLHSGVSIQDGTIIDDNVIVGANSVIGHYAFYYKKKTDGYSRMHSCGGVHLMKNVEIGAMCTIDSGVSALTIVGEGTKIDNQVHIGHDTIIGENCLLAAGVALAGCVELKNNVTLWGQVGCAADVVLEEGCVVLAQSGITKSLEAGKVYFGSPCGEVKSKYKEMAALRKLPALINKI